MERGRYLTESGRAALHALPLAARRHWRRSQGRRGQGVFRQSFAPDAVPLLTATNLTSDPDTGIGTWTDDMLARGIREGIGHDGRTLFPIMPYQKFRAHVRRGPRVPRRLPAIAAADSQSVAALRRAVSCEPLHQRAAAPDRRTGAPDLSTAEKRGEYIATVAVCADCHTPRDDQGNLAPGMHLAGGLGMEFEGRKTVASANLTPAVNGIPVLHRGSLHPDVPHRTVRSRTLDAMMPTSVYGLMTDQDLKDLFAYLKSLKPVDHFVDNTLPPTKCPRCGLTHGGGERNKRVV